MSRSKKTGAQTRRHAQKRATEKKAAKKTHSKKFLSKRPVKPDKPIVYQDDTGLFTPMRLAVMTGRPPTDFEQRDCNCPLDITGMRHLETCMKGRAD